MKRSVAVLSLPLLGLMLLGCLAQSPARAETCQTQVGVTGCVNDQFDPQASTPSDAARASWNKWALSAAAGTTNTDYQEGEAVTVTSGSNVTTVGTTSNAYGYTVAGVTSPYGDVLYSEAQQSWNCGSTSDVKDATVDDHHGHRVQAEYGQTTSCGYTVRWARVNQYRFDLPYIPPL